MMNPLEAHVTMCVADYLKLRRVVFHRPLGHLGQQPGLPDFICCMPPTGRYLGIECKAPRPLNTPRQIASFLGPKQRAQLWAIAEAGGIAIVAVDVDDVRRALGEDV